MNRLVSYALVIGLLICPARLAAHTRLKKSEPAAGARMTTAPSVIRLWFTERPELALTSLQLKDPTGKSFPLSPPMSDNTDARVVTVRIASVLPSGRYVVYWRTAATDGHPAQGSFEFFVAAEVTISPPTQPPAPAATAATTEDSNAASSAGNSIARAFLFTGLLILVGAVAFQQAILPRARILDVRVVQRIEDRTAAVGAVAAGLVIVAALIRLWLEARMMSELPGMQETSLRAVALHTEWGWVFCAQLIAAVIALFAFGLATRRIPWGWLVATIATVVLAVTPALSGHAGASSRFTSLMVVSDFLHVLGAGAWLGSLFSVMLVAVPVLFTLDGVDRWVSIASIVNSFSPMALGSAGVVAASGLIASWVHLDRISALWQTPYGNTLLIKLVLVAVTLAIGAYNFRRIQPQLVREEGVMRLRKAARLELLVGLAVLVVTGFLTGISPR